MRVGPGRAAAAIAFAGLLPLVIASLVGYLSAARSLRSDARSQLAGTARDVTVTLDRILFERFGDVDVLARGSEARSLDPAVVAHWMRVNLAVYAPSYALMYAAGADGRMFAAESAVGTLGLDGLDVSRSAWFRRSVASRGVVVTGSESATAPSISFSSAIRSPSGQVLGAWSNQLNWQVVERLLVQLARANTDRSRGPIHLYLLDRSGTLIGSDLGSAPLGIELGDLVRGRSEVPAKTFAEPARGTDIVSVADSHGYGPFPGLGWSVVAVEDKGDALAAAGSLRSRVLELGLAAGALVLLVAFAAARIVRRSDRERTQLETELRQAQKMDALGRLAGGVAHDFNNLLTVIAGHTELLLGQLPRDDERRESVEEIADAARSATAVTGQLLALSRRQVLHPEVADVAVVIRRAARLLERLLPKGVTLELEFPEDEPCWVLIDVGQLEQVVLNLVINARDAMPRGGRVLVEARHAALDGHERLAGGRYVAVSVHDTGHGMDTETLAHVFEPFFTTKPAGQGTGLGLSTVFGVVDQHGGAVEVRSEPGIGTTFTVYLPAARAPEPAPETPALTGVGEPR